MQINMPGSYIQEKDGLYHIGEHFKPLMEEGVFVMMDLFSYTNFNEIITKSLEQENLTFEMNIFEGECCKCTIDKLIKQIRKCKAKCIMGIGGGKVLDVVKAAGHFGGFKTIMVPTIASTDGPCSRISVLYEEDGTFKEYLHLHNNPDGVLVDTNVIANAPVRCLKAGIGDALSTYFETEAGYSGQLERTGSSTISQTARVISKRCFEIIIDKGCAAVEAVENKVVDEALEQVVEAIIYLSCVGFENGSLAAAHSVNNALSSKAEYNHLLHGEKVAFGTIVQMILEGERSELLRIVINFYRAIGLPYSVKLIGIRKTHISEIAKLVCAENQPIHNMRQIFVDVEVVEAALELTAKL